MTTWNVYLWGGPGTGKSTTAAEVFAKLKRLGANVELVTEWVKGKVWEGAPFDPITAWARQRQWVARLQGRVEVVICDSPPLQALVYAESTLPLDLFGRLEALALYEEATRTGLNILLRRSADKPYIEAGRNEDEAEALRLDVRIAEYVSRVLRFDTVHRIQGGPAASDAILRRLDDLTPRTPIA